MVASMPIFMERKATGRVRPKVVRKWFKDIVVMEMEFEGEFGTWPGSCKNETRYRWREVTVNDVCKAANFTF